MKRYGTLSCSKTTNSLHQSVVCGFARQQALRLGIATCRFFCGLNRILQRFLNELLGGAADLHRI